jgi:phosphate transport system permease protein
MAATDAPRVPDQPRRVDWQSRAMLSRRRRRYAAEWRLKACGLCAIVLAIGLLAVLVGSLMATGYKAFTQSMVTVEISLDPARIDRNDVFNANWRAMVREGLAAAMPGLAKSEERDYFAMFTASAHFLVRDRVVARPDLIGQTAEYTLPLSDPLDQFNKGEIRRDTPPEQRRVNDRQIAWFDALVEKGLITRPFNTGLFVNADSRFPELAGLAGAISGSFWTLLVCFLISFPTGIAAAIYLEEFAPRGKATDFIEVNINNLAAVPSVVFGLLALAVFLGVFGLPRSAPLVGGMTLALMTLPTIIIVTRNALKSVPASIREAALGIGASKHEAILHHILPLAMPTILTGTIIGLAQALGEAAPLLLIGMNAFITSPPAGIMDPATALPTQIFIWADSPERGFMARTSAAILVLLGFLIVMNAIAIFLRQRFERRW